MKNRNDDCLMELAFGDLDRETAELRAAEIAGDAAAERAVEAMRMLKRDLASLPVPECQVSVERMRDAILNQGLQPTRTPASWWRMAWMPVAAAAVAVIAMQAIGGLRKGTADGPVAYLPSARESSAEKVRLDAPGASVAEIPRNELAEAYGDALDARVGHSSVPIVRREPNRRGSASRGESVERVAAAGASAVNAGMAASVPIAAGGATDAGPTAERAEVGIVLIGAERDATTGANRAIELADSKDVLIGG